MRALENILFYNFENIIRMLHFNVLSKCKTHIGCGYANVGNIPFDHFETTVRTIYFLIVENVPLFECIKNVSSWLCDRYRNVSFYPFENVMNVTFECPLNV